MDESPASIMDKYLERPSCRTACSDGDVLEDDVDQKKQDSNDSISTRLSTGKTKRYIDYRCIYGGKTPMKSMTICKLRPVAGGGGGSTGSGTGGGSLVSEILEFLSSGGGRPAGVCTVILKLSIDVHTFYMCYKFFKYNDMSTKHQTRNHHHRMRGL